MASTYLDFVKMPQDPKKKTEVWEVRNKDSNTLLGRVAWYGAWRKYCFMVDGSFIFEEICLNDISAFIKRETTLYRAKKQAEKQ